MKAYFSIIVFVALLASSVITGTGNYIETKGRIASDLNCALVGALAEKGSEWVTADTIRTCRKLQGASKSAVAMLLHDECFSRKLSIAELRDKSYISFAVLDDDKTPSDIWQNTAGVSGDTVLMKPVSVRNAGVSVAFRANAECSFATVFSLSDQTLPTVLCLMSMIWGVVALRLSRGKSARNVISPVLCRVGNLRFDDVQKAFYNPENDEVRFTPMQTELMKMFFNADGHELGKAEICQALWPGKDDASETLYTLIRRLKCVVEQNTNLRIVGERGRAYKLTVKDES